MESEEAILGLSALAQGTRLEAFRLLVQHEPGGMAAGALARGLGVPQNTLSAHLGVLTRAGLVQSQRHSRSIVYRADITRLREVVLFLVQDCCNGRPEICTPLVADLNACSAAKEPCA